MTQQAADATDDTVDMEGQARRMGWRPKDEYGGDPARWVSAEEFVRKGEEEMPVLRERLRKQDKVIEETQKLLVDVLENQRKQTQKAVDEAISKTKAERKEAIKDGDEAKVEELDDKLDKLKDEKVETATKTTKEDLPPELKAWVEREKWFTTDPILNRLATAVYGELLKDEDLTENERLKQVSKEVRKRYPEKFTKAKTDSGSDVEGGSRNAGGGGGKTYADLPADAKGICDRLIKSMPGYTKEKYCKTYFG